MFLDMPQQARGRRVVAEDLHIVCSIVRPTACRLLDEEQNLEAAN